ncbi:MAG: hypothetical protein IKV52_04180 [Oscillospiraceae bacterium]|nr:hypothetical protein [Oscillospiraceae bacterium]
MKNKKLSLTAICLLLAIIFTVSTTIAYIFTVSPAVKNSFIAPELDHIPDEKFEDNIKEDVKIDVLDTNNLGVKSFVRAKVVVSWQEVEAGVDNLFGTMPAVSDDYVMNLNINDEKENKADGKWVLHTDGFYYYTQPVDPGESTETLITSAYQTGEAPPGYFLHIEILSQTIQADGTDQNGVMPVQLAWGVTIANDSVTAYQP